MIDRYTEPNESPISHVCEKEAGPVKAGLQKQFLSSWLADAVLRVVKLQEPVPKYPRMSDQRGQFVI